METSGLFIQRLRNFREIRDLQKLWNLKSQESLVDGSISTGIASLMHQTQTHTHLIARAAMSYWQSNQNPIKITMSYGQPNKVPTIATAASSKTLTPTD